MAARISYLLKAEQDAKEHLEKSLKNAKDIFRQSSYFTGIRKKYRHATDNPSGEVLPSDEYKHVQAQADEVLEKLASVFSHLMDVTAMKEWANQKATADIVVDNGGKQLTLLKGAPVLYLLWLSKQLEKLEGAISSVPTLDTSERWQYNKDERIYQTAPQVTQRTKKQVRFIEKSPATDKFPAQVETVYEDTPIGTWETSLLCGAVSPARKEELIARVRKLKVAVENARDEANTAKVEPVYVGQALLDYVLTP